MSGVQSVQRAFTILEALAISPSGVSDMARRVDLPKSTVARLLATLEEAGAVERGPDGITYRIGQAMRGLAAATDGSMGLIERSRPALTRLAGLTNETAGLAVAEGYQVHYLAQVDSDRNVQVRDWTGELIPMHLVPSGLAMMALWPEEDVTGYLSDALTATTARSITDAGALRQRLDEIRAAGHAWGRGEFADGINSVGAAIVDRSGKVLGAVHVHGPAYRFPVAGDEERVAQMVEDAAGFLGSADGR